MPRTREYSARHLRIFTPREGTELARTQKELEEKIAREEESQGMDMVMNWPNREDLGMEPDTTATEEGEVQGTIEEEDSDEESEGDSSIGSRCGRHQKDGGRWNV